MHLSCRFAFLLLVYATYLFLLQGCGYVTNIVLESNPPGATVYMIPRYDFEMDSTITSDPYKLQQYQIPEGVTPCSTSRREEVYVVIFELNGRREQRMLDVISGKTNKVKAEFR